jgi:hypothetical protein
VIAVSALALAVAITRRETAARRRLGVPGVWDFSLAKTPYRRC